jgi:hypothetical protein
MLFIIHIEVWDCLVYKEYFNTIVFKIINVNILNL